MLNPKEILYKDDSLYTLSLQPFTDLPNWGAIQQISKTTWGNNAISERKS